LAAFGHGGLGKGKLKITNTGDWKGYKVPPLQMWANLGAH